MRRVLLVAVSTLGCGPLAGIDDKEYVEPEVVALSGLNCTTCAVREDGSVWCWGENERGQLGREVDSFGGPERVAGIPAMRSVSVGTTHVCAVTDDDRVWCWGGNATGQSSPDDFALPECGTDLEACLAQLFDQSVGPTEIALGEPVLEVAAGMLHTCARTAAGRVYCWGSNHAGQCGRSLGKALAVIQQAPGADHVCHWSAENVAGALLLDQAAVLGGPQLVEGLGAVDELVAQRHTTCARKGAAVWCWGGNCGAGSKDPLLLGNDCSDGGQLGVSPHERCYSDAPLPVKELGSATHVNLGHVSGFASLEVSQTGVKSWGWDGGQLGHGAPTEQFSKPELVMLEGGADLSLVDDVARTNGWHQFAQSSDEWYSWGIDHCGELGQKALAEGSVSTFARRATRVPRGADALVSGQDHTCYIDSGSVYCFGHERYVGQPLDFAVGTCATEGVGCPSPQLEPKRVRFE